MHMSSFQPRSWTVDQSSPLYSSLTHFLFVCESSLWLDEGKTEAEYSAPGRYERHQHSKQWQAEGNQHLTTTTNYNISTGTEDYRDVLKSGFISEFNTSDASQSVSRWHTVVFVERAYCVKDESHKSLFVFPLLSSLFMSGMYTCPGARNCLSRHYWG